MFFYPFLYFLTFQEEDEKNWIIADALIDP